MEARTLTTIHPGRREKLRNIIEGSLFFAGTLLGSENRSVEQTNRAKIFPAIVRSSGEHSTGSDKKRLLRTAVGKCTPVQFTGPGKRFHSVRERTGGVASRKRRANGETPR